MYIRHIFQSQDIHETFNVQQGTAAQALIDLLQGVHYIGVVAGLSLETLRMLSQVESRQQQWNEVGMLQET